MTNRIGRDQDRFEQKIKRLKDQAIKKYFRNDSIGVRGKDGILRVPIRKLELPKFRYGSNEEGGVGSGEGDVGSPVPGTKPSGADSDEGTKPSEPDYDPHDHEYVEITRNELAEGLERHLKLPNLRDTFGSTAVHEHHKYTGIARIGPKSLVHFRRTFKEALKRSMASGEYDPHDPFIVPIKEDYRYRARKVSPKPLDAVVVFLLDCSGSMEKTLDFLQDVAYIADCWIEREYPRVVRRYVKYDNMAGESDRDEFFTVSSGGSTNMGVGYLRTSQVLEEYPVEQYNRIVIHLTDGDHFGLNVSAEAVLRYKEAMKTFPGFMPEMEIVPGNALTERIIPNVNALLVCEAGAYYDNGWEGPMVSKSNYSSVLEELIEAAPALRKKIRYTSFKTDELDRERTACKMETLKAWFGNGQE